MVSCCPFSSSQMSRSKTWSRTSQSHVWPLSCHRRKWVQHPEMEEKYSIEIVWWLLKNYNIPIALYRSSGVSRTLLRLFHNSVVASAIPCSVVCWRNGITVTHRTKLKKLIRKANSVLRCSLDSMEEVGKRRIMAKLLAISDNIWHPLQVTPRALSGTFSDWLLHVRCVKEYYCRSFVSAAIRLNNLHHSSCSSSSIAVAVAVAVVVLFSVVYATYCTLSYTRYFLYLL